MKNYIKPTLLHFILLVICFPLLWVVYAAWNDDVSTGDPLTADSWNEMIERTEVFSVNNGNVGIGTDTPTTMLELYSATQSRLSLTNTGNNDIKIFWKSDRTFWWAWVMRIIAINENTTIGSMNMITGSNPDEDGEIYFTTTEWWVQWERVRITSSGNVGIWITSPYGKLSVASNGFSHSTWQIVLETANSTDNATSMYTAAGGAWEWQFVIEACNSSSTSICSIKFKSRWIDTFQTTDFGPARLSVFWNLKINESSTACATSNAWEIRYDGTNFFGCNGSTWKQLDN